LEFIGVLIFALPAQFPHDVNLKCKGEGFEEREDSG
jgi:hypothetical protein